MNDLKIYVARHGQSQANHLNIIQGQTSTPLSELGMRQAEALGRALSNLDFDAVYSSDLERALQTAQRAAPSQTPQPCKELREWHLGVFQGLTYQEAEEKYPVEWHAFKNSLPGFRIPGGESGEEIYQRTHLFLEELLQRHPQGRVLLVTHGGILRSILKFALGFQGSWPIPPAVTNASYARFTVCERRWRLDCWNCTAHLAGLLEATGDF